MSCGIVILAAGSSSRLGRPKQLLQYHGKSLLCRAVDTALATQCRPVVVVLGSGGDELSGQISETGASIQINPNWQNGIGSSIKIGVSAIAEAKCDAVMLVLCDQPLVKSHALEELVRKRQATGKPICAASYSGTFGTPAVFSASLFDELLQLSDSQGGKVVIARHLAETELVELADAAMDVDTEDDFKRLSGS
jgi:molybdenum cofactor cytidylyltransferase